MGMGRLMAQSGVAMRLCALATLLLGAMSDTMPTKAPAPMSRKLLSSRASATFNQMAQQNQKFVGCSCDSCRGMVARPPAESSGHDTVSLLTCRATSTEGACGDEFCESSCKVHISSVPDANPKCHKKEVASEGLSLAQMREVTRLRTQCPPPQGCSCLCKCPEIVWPPMLPLPFMVPTPQPFFGGGASLIEENAAVEHKKFASQTSPPSLLQVSQSQEHKDSAAAAAAAAQAALQKSAVQDTIIKQTMTFPHREEESEEAKYRRHRRWLNGGGNSDPKLGLVSDEPVYNGPKEPAMVEVDYSYKQGARTFEVEPRRPVAAALQMHESAATSSASAARGNPVPYNVLPPPPGPPPKGPPMRDDFRPGFNVCPAHSPCNCYCHCKAPPASLFSFQPSHDQPVFAG